MSETEAGVDAAILTRALSVATAAAAEAGGMIRADFHRAGGPRGAGTHADVDVEAERLIRARLRGAFPAWSYLGEELQWDGSRDAPVRWLVDPNDGTAAFLRGWRGSTVSIALVMDGRPVLGVVFAPCAPDDAGDLLTWAAGQPLLRNGAAVVPAGAGSPPIILISQSADRAAYANATAVAPGRYMAVPSIAYRLALAAAGEGVAGVSLSGPVDWDIAGGHALVAAAGGDLLDESGHAVRYDGDRTHTRWCFGGDSAWSRVLAGRDWGGVLTAAAARENRRRTAPPFAVRRPGPGEAVADVGLLRRAQGCLLGQFAGDALGSLVEFRGAREIRDRYPHGPRDLADGGTWGTIAGQPTDDSEMALMLARTLADGGHDDPERTLEAYRWWLRGGPFDCGNTTHAGLTGRPNPMSEANGALMRISPLGVWGHALAPDALAQRARADARLTHPNPVCTDSAAAFTVAVAHAVRTGEGAGAAYGAALRWAREGRAHAAVVGALAAARTGPPPDDAFERNAGWTVTALHNAFYQALHAPDVETGVVETVMRGGDTDTTAAIAGALLGAIHGRDAVPARWRRAILTCRPIAGLAGVQHPRPLPFWPVDALSLAELLLVRGAAAT